MIGHDVSTDPSKIVAISSWLTLTNLKQLRGFLGLTGYYRRFIKGYGSLSKPLSDLLKRDNFRWLPVVAAAFLSLKQAMQQALVLAHPDFTKTFVVETYASYVGIGAVLMQDNHPIAYIRLGD